MPKTNLKNFKLSFTFLILLSFLTNTLKAKQAELVQIIVYHFENDAQVLQTENYLKEAFIPAMHRQKIDRIGVFKPIDFDQDKRLFLVIPYNSFSHFIKVNQQVELDNKYLTSFENMDDREAHWKAFSADEAWKTLSALPEYKNTVSKNETVFLRSTSYSDL
jgi:hypothetical protein